MISLDAHTKVYLAAGATDLRKQIDGLAALVVGVLHEAPFSSQVFCFCSRGRDKLKTLFDHTNGFWLWYRRLERQRFWWPPAGTPGPVALSLRELHWLLDGLDPQRVQAHKQAHFDLI